MSGGPRTVSETPAPPAPGFVHPRWRRDFPWLVQGTTGRSHQGRVLDLGLFSGASSSRDVQDGWDVLRRASGMPRVVHAHQVHGAAVRWHDDGPPGLLVAEPCDGHATDRPGILLTVTVADCVPVFVVDPGRRAVAALHAGWRGAAAGILERGVEVLGERVGSRPGDLHLHLGPSICGDCYEVGPEVFEGLGLDAPEAPTPVDLRAALVDRARAVGVAGDRITVSARCTLCDPGGHFSHRGGDPQRQVGYLGIRR